jgi:hypothetical protein
MLYGIAKSSAVSREFKFKLIRYFIEIGPTLSFQVTVEEKDKLF